jgi:hypothetical protein
MSKVSAEYICGVVRAAGRLDENDLGNLKFLLSIDKATMQDWYNKMDQDDINYAQELLRTAHTALMVSQIEANDEITETPDADALFAKIMSKNN